MSTRQDVSIHCPSCKFPQTHPVWKSANVQEMPELKDQLIGGRLNIFSCPQCGRRLFHEEYLLYVDPVKGLWIHVFPRDQKKNPESSIFTIYKELQKLPAPHLVPGKVVFGYDYLVKLLVLLDSRNVLQQFHKAYEETDEKKIYSLIFDEAEEYLVVRQEPKHAAGLKAAQPLFGEALQLRMEEKDAQALAAYQKAIELCPLYFAALYNAGLLCFQLLQLEQAANYFERAMDLRPNNTEVVFSLAQIFARQKNQEAALNKLYHAAVLAPQNYLVRFNLALGFKAKGWLEMAKDELQTSIDLAERHDDRQFISEIRNRI